MRKLVKIILCVFVIAGGVSFPAFSEEMSNYELQQKLKMTEERVKRLESRMGGGTADPTNEADHPTEGPIGVKGLDDRVRRIEEVLQEKPFLGKWADRITFSGLIEVEAGYEHLDAADSGAEDEKSSDLVLATAELGIDAVITEHVGGHVLFLWEEDGTDGVDLDEGFIILDGKDVLPLYLNAGRMYVPFGYYESHFISDPLTLEIGETGESAVKAGFANDWADVCLSIFNGDVDEIGEDNHIKGFVGSAIFSLPEGVVPDLGFMAGVSYTSNIADSDGLEGETPGEIEDYVGGLGGFLSVSFQDRFFLEAELITALDKFKAGELSFDGGNALEPTAWNFEFAVLPMDDLEVAVRYEGGEDLGDLLPETQFGAVVSYGLFANTALSLEYLYGEFENDDERNLLTAQLGIEF
jgi:hypothetical protein